LISILDKQLVYTGSRYPLASLFRLRKFHKRGWYCIWAASALVRCWCVMLSSRQSPNWLARVVVRAF
jgi:hypothetical protein